MYDFTIKLLDHDYLNFSTRHLGEYDKSPFIDEDYFNAAKIDTDKNIRAMNPEILFKPHLLRKPS